LKRFHLFGMAVLAFVLVGLTACDATQLLSFARSTPTPTRTPRPTFTPRPTKTPTLEPTETSEPTEVPVPPTETKKPAPPAATKKPQPTASPQPTKPAFPVRLDSSVHCPTSNTYEVYVAMKKAGANPPRPFVGGYYVALLDPGGRLLTDGAGNPLVKQTKPDGQQDNVYFGGCREGGYDSPSPYNAKFDAGDAVRAGTTRVVFRVVKSAGDLTALSPDFQIDFGKPTQYWLYYLAP
jgi:hypothetical protein